MGRRGSSGSRQARRERGRPELRAQPAGSGSAPAAPPPPRWLQPPGRPGVGSFGESLPGSGRRRRAGARSRRPRAGRGLQRLGGVPEAVGALAPGKCSWGLHPPRRPVAQGRKVCSPRPSSLAQKYSLQGPGGREGQQRWKGGCRCGFSGARDPAASLPLGDGNKCKGPHRPARRRPLWSLGWFAPRGRERTEKAVAPLVAAGGSRDGRVEARSGSFESHGDALLRWSWGWGAARKLVTHRCLCSSVRVLGGAGLPESRPHGTSASTLSDGDICRILKGSCRHLITRGGRRSVRFYSYGFVCPLNIWDVGGWYPNLLRLRVSGGGHNGGLVLGRGGILSCRGWVEAGCWGRLGNPALVSQTPIRVPEENPSASLGAHSDPPIGYSWVGHGKAAASVFAQLPEMTPAWV